MDHTKELGEYLELEKLCVVAESPEYLICVQQNVRANGEKYFTFGNLYCSENKYWFEQQGMKTFETKYKAIEEVVEFYSIKNIRA